MEIKSISPANWEKLVKILAHQAFSWPSFLAGEMPQDIEKVFQSAGLSFSPRNPKT